MFLFFRCPAGRHGPDPDSYQVLVSGFYVSRESKSDVDQGLRNQNLLNSTSVASIFRRWDSVVDVISDATTQVLACFITNNKTTSFGLVDTTAFGLALEFRDQQLDGLSSSADRFIKSNQQMLLSRSADIVLSLQRVFAKKCKRQRFDKLERRRGVHCFVSADEDFSRLFVEVVQQLLSLFVEECDTTAFDLVGTTAYWLRVFSRSIISADALHVVVQQMLYEDS
ncbi:putative protein phosphatase 2C 57 [Dorcoceras hygrometricum]|uniref:Uncharacterized protein n=1 Tax=Dorcoceras hygrometricum TaxID=472368 RepID=A0A2Z7CNP5_9LAMI|nr:putative protein phosphatase 2C 57 [Dorcoceras hygrometricum]